MGGILYTHYYGLNINGRYKFRNKRDLGLTIGGLWDKHNGINIEQYGLLTYYSLKKKERKLGVDLALTSGIFRKYYRYYRHEYLALPVLVGFDFYYNFHPKFAISLNGNVGSLFSDRSIVFPQYDQPFFNFNTFWGVFSVELKYKIKRREVK